MEYSTDSFCYIPLLLQFVVLLLLLAVLLLLLGCLLTHHYFVSCLNLLPPALFFVIES
jgi:hypothetical protein